MAPSAAAVAEDVVVRDLVLVYCAEPEEPGSFETGLRRWVAAAGTETDWMRLAGMSLMSTLGQDVGVICMVDPRSLVVSMSRILREVPVVVEVCVVSR